MDKGSGISTEKCLSGIISQIQVTRKSNRTKFSNSTFFLFFKTHGTFLFSPEFFFFLCLFLYPPFFLIFCFIFFFLFFFFFFFPLDFKVFPPPYRLASFLLLNFFFYICFLLHLFSSTSDSFFLIFFS